jgi:Zn-finger nucleic acid-binding protein
MQRYDVDIDYCPSCKGVWLDRGEIDKIAKIQSNYYNKYHYKKGENHNSYYNNRRRKKRGGLLSELFDFD